MVGLILAFVFGKIEWLLYRNEELAALRNELFYQSARGTRMCRTVNLLEFYWYSCVLNSHFFLAYFERLKKRRKK